ncbi:MAG: O-antigen ligase family protein [Pseudobdellovibrio sp.]
MILNKSKLTQYLTFFTALTLFGTWVSQSLLDLSCGILFLIWADTLFDKQTDSRVLTNKYVRLILPVMAGYFVVACLGFYFNARPGAEVSFSLQRFSWVFLFSILVWIVDRVDFEHKFFKYFYILLLIPAIYSLNIFFNDGLDVVTNKGTDHRVIGVLQSATFHSHIGGAILVAAMSYLALSFKGDIKSFLKKNWPVILTTFVILVSVLLTKTRGALLSMAISVFVFSAIWYRSNFLKWAGVLVLLAGVGLYFTSAGDALSRKGPDSCRAILAKVHVEMIKKFPLLGIGYRDNMRNISDFWPPEWSTEECEAHRTEGSQAHNQYLNVAATTGLLGLLCYLSLVIYFLVLNYKWYKWTKSDLALVALSLQTYFIFSCMTEVTFEFAKIRIIILTVWALVVSRYNRLRQTT